VWFFARLAQGSAGGLGFARAGDLLSRLVADVDALDGVYLRVVVPLAGGLVLLPALLLVSVPQGVALPVLLTVLFLFCAVALPLFGARLARSGGGALASSRAALRVAALDALTGLREVRAFGAEGAVLAQVQAREAALLQAGRMVARRAAWAQACAALCGQAALLGVLALAAPSHPVGAVVLAFVTVAVFEAAGGLPRAGVLAGAAVGGARRVLEAADRPAPVADPPHPAAPPRASGLRFEGVGFAWPGRENLFEGLTLEVPEGARIALIGPSGAGKSTLAAMALKVVAPQRGRVLLGGADIAALAAEDVRARIGWLSQRTHLFDDTIRANLLLGRPDADDAALWAALDAARIGALVRELPDGLDAWMGEGGARLSGGQARRLALARALLSPAPLLLLDEPCAGLDADTEREFFEALNASAAGRTVVLIVHRLTGAERLDRVWRLSAGRAVAAAG